MVSTGKNDGTVGLGWAGGPAVPLGGSGKVVLFRDYHDGATDSGSGSGSGSNSGNGNGSGPLGGNGSPSAAASSPSSQKGTMSFRDRLAGKSKSAATTLTASGKEIASSVFGDPSRKIESASFLSNHVVVFGSPLNIDTFVAEARRPVVSLCCYRPILYVGMTLPEKWTQLSKAYDDVYWLSGGWKYTLPIYPFRISPQHLPSQPTLCTVSNYHAELPILSSLPLY